MPRLLFVPSVRRNWGTGHLARCLRWAGRCGASLLLPVEGDQRIWGAGEIMRRYAGLIGPERIVHEPGRGENWDFVVIDRRMTNLEEFDRLAGRHAVIGVDEGGPARPYFPLLIDTFPRIGPPSPANIADEGLVAEIPPESERRADFPAVIKKVLLCFGGEDAADLTRCTWRALQDWKLFDPADMDLALGPSYPHDREYSGSHVIAGRTDIASSFRDYDLVFSAFGLSAYEALGRRVPAILVNPSPYHRRLARAAGLPEAGVGGPDRGRLERLLADPAARLIAPLRKKAAGLSGRSMHELLAGLEPGRAKGCPLCGRGRNRVRARFSNRTFFRCGCCGLDYQEAFSASTMVYDEKYFFEEYRKQYGRSYLEDFDSIKAAGAARLEVIERLRSSGTGGCQGPRRLLDVGCAYGPFLAAAAEAGYEVRGVDVSEAAVRHVREKLGLPAEKASFPDIQAGRGSGGFEVLTLWYVIEHFQSLEPVLSACRRLLVPGGLLAFSTPNGAGGSARFKRRNFLDSSPADHYSIWSEASARRVLASFGFRVRKIRVTGHHPERLAALRLAEKALGRPAAACLSRLAGLGDTFEVYAEKTGPSAGRPHD